MGDGVLVCWTGGTNQSNAMGMLEAMRLLFSNRTNRHRLDASFRPACW